LYEIYPFFIEGSSAIHWKFIRDSLLHAAIGITLEERDAFTAIARGARTFVPRQRRKALKDDEEESTGTYPRQKDNRLN
jgi:hypothetical protein